MATTVQALTVDPDQQAILKELAARELRSPEVLLREALDEYLELQRVRELLQKASPTHAEDPFDSYDGPTYSEEELEAEAIASYEHYKRTGLHLTHAEVVEWANRLKIDPQAKLPECHT